MNLKYLGQSLKQYLRMPWTAYASDVGDDLKQELEFHLASSASDYHRGGMSVEESQKAALDRFGNLNEVWRDCSDVFTSGQRLWHRIHLLTTLALVFFVGMLFINSISNDAQPQTAPARVEMAACGFSFSETTGDVLGSVSGLSGEAIAQANIIAVVKTWPPGGFCQQSYMTTTSADGTFSIEDVYAPDHKYEVQVSVLAQGRLLTSKYVDLTTGHLAPYKFELAPTDSFQVQFEDAAGEVVRNVAAIAAARTDEAGERHQVYLMGSEPLVQHSDGEGRITVSQFQPGETVSIAVQFPGQEHWQTRQIVVPETGRVVVVNEEPD
ncbi:MAG: carboxypeptidase-like regulatory domain-containing protein [Chloroflexota bacterium]